MSNESKALSERMNRPITGEEVRLAYAMGTRDFRCSSLFCASLYSVNLSGAVLTGSDLRGADLAGACLDGAELTAVDLRGAYRSEADSPIPGWKVVGGRLIRV
jgi:hypothetical protein